MPDPTAYVRYIVIVRTEIAGDTTDGNQVIAIFSPSVSSVASP
jgi:hypothetical protein